MGLLLRRDDLVTLLDLADASSLGRVLLGNLSLDLALQFGFALSHFTWVESDEQCSTADGKHFYNLVKKKVGWGSTGAFVFWILQPSVAVF